MTEPDHFRGVRRLFGFLGIVALALVCIVMVLAALMLGSLDSRGDAEESARENVERLAAVITSDEADRGIATLVKGHRGGNTHLVRSPGAVMIFAEFEGYASGIPYGGSRSVCFCIIVAGTKVAFLEAIDTCPPPNVG